tara:strand:- start:485 stop:727 length:243 start_codon:yes stop_codon:yes gene_type:complete
MNKRKKRLFIITLEIKEECWGHKVGDTIKSAVISNNTNNAIETFEDRHCGSEYPDYSITKIEDTYNTGFFMPDINTKNLM